ncbi:MAG: sigma-54-dependent Fis family transcriptional regulator [Deltaproteobacteria bacterium]|nr:sigma-54-dependent Fis family transcriptional regulator [Deltaproteobacteria bacterium]
MAETILIVDDEKSVLKALRMTLEGNYRIITAEQGSEAIKLFHEEMPDLVLLDIGLPDTNGLDVLKTMKEKDPDSIVIMVTAIDEIKTIVKAVKLGAYDYLVKPINSQELFLTAGNALENRRLKDKIRLIQQPNIDRFKFELIGQSPVVKEMIEIAKKISISVDTPVLIVGESGSGKSVLARTIHYSTTENPGPFVTINCGAIAKDLVESEIFGYERGAFTGARSDGKKGRFEESAGGTLFLDEIGAMPLSAQAKLLEVLEDKIFYRVGGTKKIPLSSRIISATNIDLKKAVEQGLFRNDIYYRLNVVKIKVPPLRERKDDILLLAEYFMSHYNQRFDKRFVKVSPEAKKILLQYAWPGNIRELRNTIERIILLENGDTLLPEHLASISNLNERQGDGAVFNLSRGSLDYKKVTKALIEEALKRTGGNVVEGAKILNIPIHKLRYRIKKFGLKI